MKLLDFWFVSSPISNFNVKFIEVLCHDFHILHLYFFSLVELCFLLTKDIY